MPGLPDIEVSQTMLGRLAPEATLIRRDLDCGTPIDCAGSIAALARLAREDAQLESKLATRETELDDTGANAHRDREHRALRAARLLVRQTAMELGRRMMESSGYDDAEEAATLLLKQQAELWSARTGLGRESKTLRSMPTPRESGQTPRGHADMMRKAALIGPFRMAKSPEDLELARIAVQAAGEDPAKIERLLARHPDGFSEPLEEAIERVVDALEAERKRDPKFVAFLLHRGITARRRRSPNRSMRSAAGSR